MDHCCTTIFLALFLSKLCISLLASRYLSTLSRYILSGSVTGPLLVIFGLGTGLTGFYLCVSNRRMVRDLKARRRQYRSFSLASACSQPGDIASVTSTYQQILVDSATQCQQVSPGCD